MKLAAPQPKHFTSRMRGPEVTARIGVWLGVCFAVAFVTGLISHFAQNPPGWLTFPTRPVSLYRVTQGLHLITGTAAVPLLLAKLWSVFPKLFERLHLRDRRLLALELAERGSIAVLVAAAIFELATGLANSSQWYPWSFSFRSTHYAVAWLAIGALLVHIAVKLPLIRTALTAPLDEDPEATARSGGLTRRSLLRTTWLAAAVAMLGTAGATVPVLRKVSVFGVRSGGGPQGIPINKSAYAAQVISTALNPSYALQLVHGEKTTSLTRADLEAMEQNRATLPISCVEGWSASADWTGVRVRDLLALVGAPADADIQVESLQPSGGYRVTTLQSQFANDPLTLLALQLNGDTLSIDHGYPCRIIAPDRPGVLQTKWVAKMSVLA
jgi:hypothetical protein